jgi:hypothetical protein
MTTTQAPTLFADAMPYSTPRLIIVTTPRNLLNQGTYDEHRRDSCGWMCLKANCFSACTRESVHPGNHFCGGGHTY